MPAASAGGPDAAAQLDAQARAVDAARDHRRTRGSRILRELAELVALPNVSRDLPDVRRNAEALQEAFRGRGVAVELTSLDEAAPVITGRLAAPGATRTIGVYAHYDGQPVDPAEWLQDPFAPTLYTAPAETGGRARPLPGDGEAVDPEWRLYGRGTADDKAPFVALLSALDALAAAGLAFTSDVVFLFEGEEEIGSPHLSRYLRELRSDLAADVWLICDGPVHQSRRPQIVFGVRGFSGLEITVYGPVRELHSGHYGNWAPNPALLLAQLLASMKDPSGQVLIHGFYDSTASLTDDDRAALGALPAIDDELRHECGLAATEAGDASHAERMLLPSFNVRGLASGAVGDAARNVVPAQARASIDVRLAPGNDPAAMLDLVEAHIRRQGFHIVTGTPDQATRLAHPRIARVDREEGYPAARTSPALPVARQVLDAAGVAADEPVIALPTLGGSVPLHGFTEILGAPVVVVPIANHDNNQHAANENLRVANLWYGIDLMAALLTMPS